MMTLTGEVFGQIFTKTVTVGGQEDDGRAGSIRRRARGAVETVQNVARGLLGRLRRR